MKKNYKELSEDGLKGLVGKIWNGTGGEDEQE